MSDVEYKEIPIENFQIEEKYLPFLIPKDEQFIVHNTGYSNGRIVLRFMDGLEGVFLYDPYYKDQKTIFQNPGYFVVDKETGVFLKYIYKDVPVVKTKTSRVGSMQQKVNY